jgi:hypothetical protein
MGQSMTALAIRPELSKTETRYDPLTWQQELVLTAAAQADCIPFRNFVDEGPGMIPNGVYRSLVIRGLLRQHPLGFEITDEGRFEVHYRLEARR